MDPDLDACPRNFTSLGRSSIRALRNGNSAFVSGSLVNISLKIRIPFPVISEDKLFHDFFIRKICSNKCSLKSLWSSIVARHQILSNFSRYAHPNSVHTSILQVGSAHRNAYQCKIACEVHYHWLYRLGTVNSKSFIGKVFLRIKWKFELYYTL